jgi:hypothetical protein
MTVFLVDDYSHFKGVSSDKIGGKLDDWEKELIGKLESFLFSICENKCDAVFQSIRKNL